MIDSGAWAGKRILVTGAAGFVGGHLVDALVKAGAKVAALDLDSSLRQAPDRGRFPPQVIVFRRDLTSGAIGDALESFNPDTVFHLAGHASVPGSFKNPRLDFWQNVVASFELFDALRQMVCPPKVVAASSAAVYGVGGRTPLRENQLPFPTSPYGASKLCMETYLQSFCRSYGLRGSSVRLFSLFGPGLRKHLVFDLFVKLTKDPSVLKVVGDGRQIREFLYISDCVEALMAVAARGKLRGEVVNAAGGTVITVRELVSEVARVMSLDPEVVFTGEDREGGLDRWTADGSHLRALGFEPRVSLQEGLRNTLNWFSSHEAPRIGLQKAPTNG